jgi:hypothetical protein
LRQIASIALALCRAGRNKPGPDFHCDVFRDPTTDVLPTMHRLPHIARKAVGTPDPDLHRWQILADHLHKTRKGVVHFDAPPALSGKICSARLKPPNTRKTLTHSRPGTQPHPFEGLIFECQTL